MKILRPIAALLALALPSAACFSERSSVTPVTDADLCGAAQPGVVQIRDYAFQPAQLRVSRGARVTWVNCDADLHTSTADAGAWRSPLLARDEVFTHTFDAVGEYGFHCEPHPFMTGSVVVE